MNRREFEQAAALAAQQSHAARTTIIAVVHDDGQPALCRYHPNAILFEVASAGPHLGKRGCDACLYDLVGPISHNKAQVASYETGQRRPA
jgi:hypothetical protein